MAYNYNQVEHQWGEQYSEYPVESDHGAYVKMGGYENLVWQTQQLLGGNPNPMGAMREYGYQMGEQYSEYPVGENHEAYMYMEDHRNASWQWQQPTERGTNPPRSMRDYMDQWMSAPSYGPPLQCAPTAPPQYTLSSQSQPPQPISPLEQAILDLSKIVDNFKEERRALSVQGNKKIDVVEDPLDLKVHGLKTDLEQKWDHLQDSTENLIVQKQGPPEEEQKALSVQGNQETDIVENSLDPNLNGLQGKIDQKLDGLQGGINVQCPSSKVAQHHNHQKEENQEEQSQIDATVEEQCEDQDAATSPLLTKESSGQEKWEEPQKFIPQPNPIELDLSTITQPEHKPLQQLLQEEFIQEPVKTPEELLGREAGGDTGEGEMGEYSQPPSNATADAQVQIVPSLPAQTTPKSSPLSVYILPVSAAHPKPKISAPKAKSTPSLPAMQKLKRLVASVQGNATTSKTMAATYTAWHSGWFERRFGLGAPEPGISKLHQLLQHH